MTKMHPTGSLHTEATRPFDCIPLLSFVLLFSVALVPRVAGLLTFHNPDEAWGASVRVLTGDLSGGAGLNPPLVNYLNAASFVVLYIVGRLTGIWHGVDDFRTQYFVDPAPFFFSGRLAAACAGALAAPLAAAIAARFGLHRRSALVVGLLVALLPINILLSHFARPDVWAATAVLFFCWAMLRALDQPETRSAFPLVGAAVAFALSIKQTNLFVVLPLLVGFAWLLRQRSGRAWSMILRGAGIAALTCVIVAIPLTVGILQDIRGFIDYQRVSVVLNRREGSLETLLGSALEFATANLGGLTAAGLIAYILAPLSRRDPRLWLLGGAAAIGFGAFTLLSGSSIVPRYVHPYVLLGFTVACVGALSWVERPGSVRWLGIALTVGILGSVTLGSLTLLRQAIATPIGARTAEILRKHADPEKDKILANRTDRNFVGLPISAAAREEDAARHIRLSQKYGVSLNERPPEREAALKGRASVGYHVRGIPFAMGGLQDIDQEAAEKAVKPYMWPIQISEWNLDYWTDQGFTLFVVADEANWLKSDVKPYQQLHQQIHDRCELLADLPTIRTSWFFETPVRIYRCPGAK